MSEFNDDPDAYPMFGKTPERDFAINEMIGDSLVALWDNDTKGSFTNSSFTASSNFLFVSDLSGRITCFNIETGKTEGAITTKGDVSVAPLIYKTRIYYVLNEKNEEYSTFILYDVQQGKQIKEIEIEGGCTNELLLVNEEIYILNDEGTLYCFTGFGKLKWKYETGQITLTDPVYQDSNIWFANSEGEIIAISLDGKLIVKSKIAKKSNFEGSLIARNNNVYLADNRGVVYSFNCKTKVVNWKSQTGGFNILACPVVKDNLIICGSVSGELMALEIKSGELIWQNNLGGLITATPLVFNDFILQPDVNKILWFVDYKNGEIIKKIEFDDRLKTVPVYIKNKLIIGYDRGIVEAFTPQR